MADLFETAMAFYKQSPTDQEKDPNMLAVSKELTFIIDSSPFITDGEKKRLKDMMPMLSISMLEKLKNDLLKEGVAYHDNHKQDKKIIRWLRLVVKKNTVKK